MSSSLQCHATVINQLERTARGIGGRLIYKSISTRCKQSRRTMNALPESVDLAISQQALAFGLCVIGEGIYTRIQMKPGAKGRPQIPIFATAAAGYAATFACLIGQQSSLQTAGVIAGTATSALMLITNILRFVNTEDNPREWPGPKSWPAAMSLGSLFMTFAFAQALSTLF